MLQIFEVKKKNVDIYIKLLCLSKDKYSKSWWEKLNVCVYPKIGRLKIDKNNIFVIKLRFLST